MKTHAIAAALSLSCIAAPALAADIEVEVDLRMLETRQGTAIVYEKLEKKAVRSCRQMTSRLPTHLRACEADLMEQFVEDLDHPMLTAHHRGKDAPLYASRG
ncbi:UrcA family protein [Parvularcula sp. ZS-1/3]|uniref:UrcA family protein n=1 Tax=Parvularcula mediterranea TaxID=2732508 RepID=A0A7Y3RN49_9PROT|nr:UrcA family protein [Parvularcula mediterranea]NNU16332.1 UrcA family protein [Parvularcula mediterranea]